MAYIKKFQDISRSDVKEVGGKGASLGEMTKANIPVPPGFVITTEVFDDKLVSIDTKMSQALEEHILKAFDELSAEKVSVRSSAVAEDSSSASWAGQLETYLNISREDLIEKIKECWESVKSERALDYASAQKSSEADLQIAVVVQKMVDSQSAGVMFTANPITNATDEIMIESVLGLGESLVSGAVTPDNFIVDKETGDIISRDLQQEEQTITEEKIKELVSLGKRIEDHYKRPQDIEWATDSDDKIWILQSRPITTL